MSDPLAPEADPDSKSEAAPVQPSVRLEILAGLTTFLTMSYIAMVNPEILGAAGFDKGQVVTATILAAAFGSILMGLVARLPYALAPGMGLNAFFTFELVLRGREVKPMTWVLMVVALGLLYLEHWKT